MSERDKRILFAMVAVFFTLWTILCVKLGVKYGTTPPSTQPDFWPVALWMAPWFGWAAGAIAYCNWPDRDKGRYRDD